MKKVGEAEILGTKCDIFLGVEDQGESWRVSIRYLFGDLDGYQVNGDYLKPGKGGEHDMRLSYDPTTGTGQKLLALSLLLGAHYTDGMQMLKPGYPPTIQSLAKECIPQESP